jgi:hypothetical protein
MSNTVLSALAVLLTLSLPAGAFELAQDLTCDQAIAYYQKNHVIYVLTNDVIALPVSVGVPVKDAAKLQCTEQGQVPHGYSVRTKDRWRCVIAMTC